VALLCGGKRGELCGDVELCSGVDLCGDGRCGPLRRRAAPLRQWAVADAVGCLEELWGRERRREEK
jgi:hypothetical protein